MGKQRSASFPHIMFKFPKKPVPPPCEDETEVKYICKPECTNTCLNLKSRKALCPTSCRPVCFCTAGVVKKESDGKCASLYQCNHVPCPNSNEVEYVCKPSYKNTCKNCKNPNALCPAVCIQGCFCKPGLVKKECDGQCIGPEQCCLAPCPGADEVEYIRKPFCKNTCKYCNNHNAVCPALCVQGCFYKPGLDSRCVCLEQCNTVQCPVNEELSNCMNICDDFKMKGKCKFLVCKKACDCRKGKCIREDQCPIHCPVNEESSNFINHCNDCKVKGKCNFCVRNKGCDCFKGYHRDQAGKCIHQEQCLVEPSCPQDEELHFSVPTCNHTCHNYGRNMSCPEMCRPGCSTGRA